MKKLKFRKVIKIFPRLHCLILVVSNFKTHSSNMRETQHGFHGFLVGMHSPQYAWIEGTLQDDYPVLSRDVEVMAEQAGPGIIPDELSLEKHDKIGSITSSKKLSFTHSGRPNFPSHEKLHFGNVCLLQWTARFLVTGSMLKSVVIINRWYMDKCL